MADNVQQINANKLAVFNKKYYDLNGKTYIGLQNGRLKILSDLNTFIDTKDTETEEEVYNKVIDYNSDGDIAYIRNYQKGKLIFTSAFLYDSLGNIVQITISGDRQSIKTFTYDSLGNITNINQI